MNIAAYTQSYNDDLLYKYQQTLVDIEEEKEKCAGCLQEGETRVFSMHDQFEGKKKNYCKSCIEYYLEDTL